MKWVALVLRLLPVRFWPYGGIRYARIGDTEIYYFLGWVTAAMYLPLYLYRTRDRGQEARQRHGAAAVDGGGGRMSGPSKLGAGAEFAPRTSRGG